jgi:hypothetical protein
MRAAEAALGAGDHHGLPSPVWAREALPDPERRAHPRSILKVVIAMLKAGLLLASCKNLYGSQMEKKTYS